MPKPNAREMAFRILDQYYGENKDLDSVLDSVLDKHVSRRDRNFTYNLAKGTIRYQYFLEYSICQWSKLQLSQLDREVITILKLAAYQALFMDKVPSYSIVDESVKLTKKNVHEGAAKFVNAVLRRLCAQDKPYLYIMDQLDRKQYSEIKKMSIKFSFPGWIIKYWVDNYGKSKAEQIMESLNREPCTFLRMEPGLNRNELADRLNLSEEVRQTDTALPEKLGQINFRLKSLSNIVDSRWFKKGLVTVQDISSQIAVKYFLDPRPGEKILDLCAAPGGKSMFASQLMAGEGQIVAVDINQNKLEKMQENIKRLSIKNIELVQDDATRLKSVDNEQCFDKVFLDAPCSALGTISKNPDAKYSRTYQDLHRLGQNSLKMINCAKSLLKEGGSLIFYTCTLSPIENQQIIDQFLKSNPEFRIIGHFQKGLKIEEKTQYLEIMPYFYGSEGGFVCQLIKGKT